MQGLHSATTPLTIRLESKIKRINLYRGAGLGYLHPHAILDSEGKRFFLYYTPYPPDPAEVPYIAVSANGLDFVSSSQPLLRQGPPGSWDNRYLADVEVVYYGGKWYLYYAGADYSGRRRKTFIGLALSSNGIRWSKYRGNPVLVSSGELWYERGTPTFLNLSCPTVFVKDGLFYMYYAALGGDGVQRIALATSEDGVHFQKQGVVLEPKFWWERGGLNHPHVSVAGDHVVLLYLGYDGCTRHLGLAVATLDGPENFRRRSVPLMESFAAMRGGRCIHEGFLHRVFRSALRGVAKYGLKAVPYPLPSPFWYYGSIYRSSLLTYPDKRVALLEGNKTLLYVSAYSLFSKIPSIGVVEASIFGS